MLSEICRSIVGGVILAISIPVLARAACGSAGMNPQPLSFGNYTGAQNDAIGSVQVYCNSGSFSAAGVGLSMGSAPTYYPRTMKNGTNSLQYNLYTTSARQFVWGDGSGGTSFPGITNGAVNQTFSIYGRIPGSQSVPLGSYTDTIVITIFF